MPIEDDAKTRAMPIEIEIEGWLGRNLRRATNAVLSHFIAEFAAFGMRPALYLALSLIERFPASSGAELSQHMELPRANMVLILQELERRDLIRRTAGTAGGRSQAISLSAAGAALMPELHAANRRHVAFFDAQMTDAERAFLTALLKRLWKPPPA